MERQRKALQEFNVKLNEPLGVLLQQLLGRDDNEPPLKIDKNLVFSNEVPGKSLALLIL